MTRTDADADADRVREALLPLRTRLRRHALREADRLREDADEDARVAVGRARDQAAAMIAQARAQGEQEAVTAADAARAAGRREGRALVLTARRQAYEELRRRVRDDAESVLSPGWQRRVGDEARRALGPDALVRCASGEVTAEGGGRRLRWSVETIAERAVADLGSRVEQLWTA